MEARIHAWPSRETMFRPFTNQEWGYMGGYVQKDMGKPHFRLFVYPTIDVGAYSV